MCAKKGNIVLPDWDALPMGQRGLLLPRGPYALHAMPTSAGHERVTTAAYRWHGRERGRSEFALLQHTLEGHGRLSHGGRTHRLAPGTTLLLTIPDDHEYAYDGTPWRFVYICLHGAEILRAWRRMLAVRGPVARLAPHDAALHTVHGLVRDALAERITDPRAASARVYGLAMALLESLDPAPTGAARPARPAAVQAAIDLVRRADGAPVSVAAMAAAAGYSRHHFSRQFKASEGVGPGAYVLRERLRRAARMLERTDLPVKAIADACGFHDARHLAKAFRNAYAVPPAALRRSGMYR